MSAWGPELLSGLIGGLIVFGLTTWRDWRKTRKLIKRKRNGLLRLIDIEVYQNIDRLEMIKKNPDIGEQYRAYSELHTAHWDENRGRLAQLLSTDYIGVLVRYYGLLDRIGVNLGDEGKRTPRRVARNKNMKEKVAVRDASRKTLISVLAREALKYGEEVRRRAAGYIKETPDYFELYKNQEQETEPSQEEKANKTR